ncbi:hypothetical protein CKO25_12420 [Thiocapsa imhoffii]|uniref:DUF2939 domain-containing protein n=1 Tax=Thiocapsa imhoffii TaxID=382777 RepID=A0A9X0WIM9_9GAMM|nr:DUF2939 domain-containing protein [Thiocapsa imhoffii]MBK1645434.1 hypothetical protein [Thiocapsa imhoffii]
MRLFGYLLLFMLLGYGIWPYFTVFRLDEAINQEGTAHLATMVDLTAIRANYKARVNAGIDGVFPDSSPDSVMGWIRQNVDRLGDSALDQAITLPWVRDTLRESVTKATGQSPPYLLAAIDFAFFESFNQFVIRIGELGHGPTHVRLQRQGTDWMITDLIQ